MGGMSERRALEPEKRFRRDEPAFMLPGRRSMLDAMRLIAPISERSRACSFTIAEPNARALAPL